MLPKKCRTAVRRVALHTHLLSAGFMAGLLVMPEGAFAAGNLVEAHFDLGPDGFAYVDDAFRGTRQPAFASGTWLAISFVWSGV